MDYLFDLLDLLNFNNLLNNLLDCNDFWYFHYPIHYFLNYLLNFDYFRADSEYFKNIIDIYGIYNLGINHSYNSLIDL